MSRFYGKLFNGRGTPATKCGHQSTGLSAQANGWEIGGDVAIRDCAGIDVVDLEMTGGTNGAPRRLHVASFTRNGNGYAVHGGALLDLMDAADRAADWMDDNRDPADTGEGQNAINRVRELRAALAAFGREVQL